jgi:bacterioferritin-associated ferredoxin
MELRSAALSVSDLLQSQTCSGACASCPRDCSERLVCRCLQVTESEVVTAIHTGEVRTLRDLRRHTGAGDGCTCCHERLRQLLERHAQSSSSSEPICSVK